MLLLLGRVECIDRPVWFYEAARLPNYPQVVPPGKPNLPFTIVAVATAAETEEVYYDRLRPQAKYRDAYDLAPAPPADADEPAPKSVNIP